MIELLAKFVGKILNNGINILIRNYRLNKV